MIEINRLRGAKRPPLNTIEANQKIDAYIEWKQGLEEPQQKLLSFYEKMLVKSLRDCGDRSACELMAEILLTERTIRER